MDLSRRQLFRFGAAAVLSAVVAPAAFGTPAPVLWGDGVHDDTEALQAAIDGRPVTVAGVRIRIEEGAISGGIYAVSRAIVVANKSNWTMEKMTLQLTEDFSGTELLHLKNINGCRLQDMYLDLRKPSERNKLETANGDWFSGIRIVA